MVEEELAPYRAAGDDGRITASGPEVSLEPRTAQTLAVVRVDAERGLLLVKGSVPGADGGHVVVHPAAKTPAAKGA